MSQRDIKLDLTLLHNLMIKCAFRNRIALKDALSSRRFAQIGINMFRDQVDNCIWAIEKDADGSEYIVRSEVDSNLWTTHTNVIAETVTLSFSGVPIYKFAGQEYGFDKGSIVQFKEYIVNKVKDPLFVKSLYAFVTNKCPNCGNVPKSVGLSKIECDCKK